MAKELDFTAAGAVAGMTCIGRVDDEDIGPNDRTDFFITLKNVDTVNHTVDLAITLNPLGPPVSIDHPGPDIGSRTGVTLTPGQIEKVQFLIKNDSTGVTPATYNLTVTMTVDTAVQGPFLMVVP